jgi:hypothetical protein
LSTVAIRARALLIELKARRRYVRTREGSERYGLPIGSPIVARERPSVGRARGVRAVPNKPREMNVDLSPAVGLERDTPEYDRNGLAWREPTQYEEDRGIIQAADREGGGRLYVWEDRSDPYGSRYRGGKGYGATIFDKDGKRLAWRRDFASVAEARKWVLSEQRKLNEENKEKEARKPRRIERNYQNFADLHAGVYGRDWSWGDEDQQLIDDAFDNDNPEAQARALRRLAVMESQNLEISVVHEAGGPRIDIEAHEDVNAVVRAHVDHYPGIQAYFPVFRMADHGNSYAFNQRSLAGDLFTTGPRIGSDGVERYWNHSEIGLSTSMFAEGFDRELAESRTYRDSDGHFTIDFRREALNSELEAHRLHRMYMLTHEVGHSVMHMAGDIYPTANGSNEQHGAEFRSELVEVLKKYGVVAEDRIGANLLRYSQAELTWNKDIIAEHHSKYAATNIDEMGAEAWAAYWHSDSPTEMQVEIAQLMEQYMVKFLEREYQE